MANFFFVSFLVSRVWLFVSYETRDHIYDMIVLIIIFLKLFVSNFKRERLSSGHLVMSRTKGKGAVWLEMGAISEVRRLVCDCPVSRTTLN